MKTKLMALVLFAASGLFAQVRVYVGAHVGYSAPPPVVMYAAPPAPLVTAYMPPSPGYGYSWVNGYWYPVGHRYVWRTGYWSRPAYHGARWVAPRYRSGRYYHGYWRR